MIQEVGRNHLIVSSGLKQFWFFFCSFLTCFFSDFSCFLSLPYCHISAFCSSFFSLPFSFCFLVFTPVCLFLFASSFKGQLDLLTSACWHQGSKARSLTSVGCSACNYKVHVDAALCPSSKASQHLSDHRSMKYQQEWHLSAQQEFKSISPGIWKSWIWVLPGNEWGYIFWKDRAVPLAS